MNELPSNRREDKNLCGTRINHFKVIGSNEEKIGHNRVWLCKCDCGRITYVRHSELLTGRAKSCGCFIYYNPNHKPKNYVHVWISDDDQDIMQKLKHVDNIGDYIKQLIRQDIRKDEQHAQKQPNRTEDPA